MRDIAKVIGVILLLIILYQPIKAIKGGTWAIEDIILALIIFNLTITITLLASFYKVKNKIDDNIEWHKEYDIGNDTNFSLICR